MSSPERDMYETISWDIYNIQYGSPKTRASMFHSLNKIVPSLIEEMTIYERTELIRLILKQQDRRKELGIDLYSVSDISLLSLQSDTVTVGSDITDNSNVVQTPSNDQEEVIVRYLDENPGACIEHAPVLDSKTFHGDFVEDHDISKYLSRPVSIATISWAEGAKLNTSLQPWDLFFNTTQVRKKIDNFARITCNLHIKVILNASPFYYGCGLVSYQPLTTFNASTISSQLTTNGDAHICALSQRPHFWIYPQTNQGGEMVLPFLNYKTWLQVASRGDFQAFGTLTLQSPTVLYNANSVAVANVTVQVYAWATDVKLCGPTNSLALQSEEYGLISGPASSVANIAKKLSSVPMIGPYATATGMVASGVGKLAKLFGFTNAPVMEDVKPIKNLPFHGFSSCEVSQPIEKLTIDPKNELSIDSRLCGHDGTDELLLTNFIQRESYLLQATWAAAHTTGQVLIRGNVTPDTKIVETHTIPYIQGTPMSHAFQLYKYWRGDIIYRFRFICSKFHRGRVKIQWDPQGSIASAIDSNLVHTQIVDISTETDVEFRIPYLAQQPFCRSTYNPYTLNSVETTNITNTGTLETFNDQKHNGTFNLSVLTQQTSPVASADIIILVSARAAENMTYAMPQQPPQSVSFFDLQSQDVDIGGSAGFNYDATKHYDLTTKAPVLPDETFLVNMGERITSLRQNMRRTQLHRTLNLTVTPSTTAMYFYYGDHARLPLAFGYDPNGINTADSTLLPGNNKPFNFVFNHPITWISTCFVGVRGSINWHYNIDNFNWVNNFTVARFHGPGITAANYSGNDFPVTTSASTFARSQLTYRANGGQGCALSNTRTQSGISAQYPFYGYYRMWTPNPTKLVLGSSSDSSDQDHARWEAVLQPQSFDASIPTIDFYASCGTDFTCIYFLNVPTVCNYGVYPAAV